MVLECSDLPGLKTPCCADCRATASLKTVVYPPGVFFTDKPDLGMGIRGQICCNHIHNAQRLPRNWWYEKYLRDSKRFTEQEIQWALRATPNDHYKVFGEIHAAARQREMNKIVTQPKRLLTQRTGQNNCPECGSRWNETICNNCGFAN